MTRKYRRPYKPLSSWTDSSSSSEDGSDYNGDDFQQYEVEWQSNAVRPTSLDFEDALSEDESSKGGNKKTAPSYLLSALCFRRRSILAVLAVLLLGMVISLSVYGARNNASAVPLSGDPVQGQSGDPGNDNLETSTDTPSTLSPFYIQDIPSTEPSPTASPITNPETSSPTATFVVPDTLAPTVTTPAPLMVLTSPPSAPSSTQTSPVPSQLPPSAETVVLYPNEYLTGGQIRSSPNGKFKVGLSDSGDFMLMDGISNGIIWSTSTTGGTGARVYMHTDANAMVLNAQKTTLWSSETHGYPGARLILSDSGQLAIKTIGEGGVTVTLWMDGVPQSIYNGSPPEDLTFPVRAAFYYP
jgi:hypothetical protein